ncbi:MAG: bifunctional adenosylcobinamide kinase/adenosylcobinamide-phosphate guanylyltransferase [Spirochaetaceae bacterium]|jgi:adenosyl cobinamide kinase/adenosyl cobinamide phosphate guanylyltransferase|nr:bifunctional adenosylcobinamide kinase/adenosylcobinamide-phosphate guanylyltransferase [Spirochaetaceae bacterium]
MITLITGGVKSGKSSRALAIAAQNNWPAPVAFIATAESSDEETRERVRRHKAERAALGALFCTVEEPLRLDTALSGRQYAVVDCIPMWVNNLLYHKRQADFEAILDGFERALRSCANCVIVTNETGLGNIPFDEETRRFNMMLALANKRLAACAHRVELMVCGLVLTVKDET